MAADCTCGHPQSKHKGLKLGCRGCDIGCSRYEPEEASQPAADDERELAAARREIEQLRAAADGCVQAWNPPAEVIYAYDAWQCLTCGARYIPATAAEDHPHELTPVRVTVARRSA